MLSFLEKHSDRIYAAVRIITGLLFFCHGAQKLFGLFGGGPPAMNGTLWIAGFIEFFGGGMIALGVLTRWAALIASGQMAFAYFIVHQPRALVPIQNHGELAIIYCWVFLFIAARGTGRWGLDDLAACISRRTPSQGRAESRKAA